MMPLTIGIILIGGFAVLVAVFIYDARTIGFFFNTKIEKLFELFVDIFVMELAYYQLVIGVYLLMLWKAGA